MVAASVAGCAATSQVSDARKVLGTARYAVQVAGPIGSYSNAMLEFEDPTLQQGVATPAAAATYERLSGEVGAAATQLGKVTPPASAVRDHRAAAAAMERVAGGLHRAAVDARRRRPRRLSHDLQAVARAQQDVSAALSSLAGNSGPGVELPNGAALGPSADR